MHASRSQNQRTLTRLRRLVAFDRLLARLFAQGASSRWVVKGGFGLEIRYALAARTTKDLDLCLRTQGSRQAETGSGDVLDLLRRAAEIDLDGFVVRIRAPGKVRQDAAPRSFRFPVEVLLAGRPFARFHLDVSTGHVRKETVDWVLGTDYLTFAEIPPTRLGIISVEQQIAEKLHALTRPRGRGTNTRVKDLVDLAVLVERENPAAGGVKAALKSTFNTYSTHPMPRDLPPPPESWTGPYAALADEVGVSARTRREACRLLDRFWKRLAVLRRSSSKG